MKLFVMNDVLGDIYIIEFSSLNDIPFAIFLLSLLFLLINVPFDSKLKVFNTTNGIFDSNNRFNCLWM